MASGQRWQNKATMLKAKFRTSARLSSMLFFSIPAMKLAIVWMSSSGYKFLSNHWHMLTLTDGVLS